MTWWTRLGLCCLPWLLFGCRGSLLRESNFRETKQTAAIEKTSIRVWSEQRAVFSETRAETVAWAWERNLRTLQLKPARTGNIVECKLPEGGVFSLSFWQDKELGEGKIQGELTWHDPGDAGRGMKTLLELEKKHRSEGEIKKANRWSSPADGDLLLIENQEKPKKAADAKALGKSLYAPFAFVGRNNDRLGMAEKPAPAAPDTKRASFVQRPLSPREPVHGIVPAGTVTPDLNIPLRGTAETPAIEFGVADDAQKK